MTSTTLDTDIELLPPTSAEAVRRNAEALLPLVAEEADGIEADARLTPRAEAAMRAAGVFEMAFPARRGGLEMTLADQLEVTATVAAVDASAGWNIGVLNAGGIYATRLGDEAYAELYPTRDHPTSGSFHPRGRADRVEGGYLVSGQWDWGSGSYTADYIVGGGEVFDDGEPVLDDQGVQRVLGFWLPQEALIIEHNWQTLGVRGTGSTSYRIDTPTFVPERYTFDRLAPDTADADPLNKSVTLAHFALGGVVLGIARHLVQLTGETILVRGGARADSTTKQALGEMMAEVDYAYAGARETARMTDEIIFTPGRGLTPLERARMTAANTASAGALQRVLTQCIEIASAHYIRDRNPIQRVIRDAMSALAHAGTRKKHLVALAHAALTDPSGGWTVPDRPSHGLPDGRW